MKKFLGRNLLIRLFVLRHFPSFPLLLLLFLPLGHSSAYALVNEPMYRSARSSAMGGAITAIAENEEALFLNPAALVGVKNLSFHLLDFNLEAGNDLIADRQKFTQSLNHPSLDTFNELLGQNFWTRAEAVSSVVLPGLGFALLADEQISVRMNNAILPAGTMSMQTTYGMQGGLGFPLIQFSRHKGSLRFGIAGKLLWRQGGILTPTVSEILTLNIKNLTSKVAPFGTGFGVDSGFQLVYKPKKNWTLLGSLVMTDMGATSFSSGAQVQYSNLTMGLGAVFQSHGLTLTLAYDYSNIFQSVDWRKKNHLGFQFRYAVFDLYAGLNEVYPTYGGKLNLGLLQLMFVSYAEELGPLMYICSERRSLIRLALTFDL